MNTATPTAIQLQPTRKTVSTAACTNKNGVHRIHSILSRGGPTGSCWVASLAASDEVATTGTSTDTPDSNLESAISFAMATRSSHKHARLLTNATNHPSLWQHSSPYGQHLNRSKPCSISLERLLTNPNISCLYNWICTAIRGHPETDQGPTNWPIPLILAYGRRGLQSNLTPGQHVSSQQNTAKHQTFSKNGFPETGSFKETPIRLDCPGT